MLVDSGSCADAEQMMNAGEERMRSEINIFLLTSGWGAQRKSHTYIANIKTKYSKLRFYIY